MLDQTRSSRRSDKRRQWTLALLVAAIVFGVVAVAAGIWGIAQQRQKDEAATPTAAVTTASVATTDAAQPVELPNVIGLGTDQARVVLEAAGVSVVVEESTESVVVEPAQKVVLSQDPPAGTLVSAGSSITLVVPRVRQTAAPKGDVAPTRFVVCIDPGHQTKSDSTPEPVGPGSTTTKPAVTGGASGVVTKIPEYEIVLQISNNVKRRLEARGVTVVMTRTTNDVSLSNAERAAIANKAKADLFLRIHGDGSPDKDTVGISTLYPGSNKWTKGFSGRSKTAATLMQKNLVSATGAVDRGIVARQDISGFNWSKVPSILVECGFLSNPVEDRLLASPHYQDKLAQAMADSAIAYLEQEAAR